MVSVIPAMSNNICICFFFTKAAPTEIYTLSLHDALPISATCSCGTDGRPGGRVSHRSLPSSNPSPTSRDRKSTRLNSSHLGISYAVFCLKKKINNIQWNTLKEVRQILEPTIFNGLLQ